MMNLLFILAALVLSLLLLREICQDLAGRNWRQRGRRWRRWAGRSANTGEGSLAGKLGHAGQHQDDACGQHDEGREMCDHGFVSTKQKR
jgi:hypothetical protein